MEAFFIGLFGGLLGGIVFGGIAFLKRATTYGERDKTPVTEEDVYRNHAVDWGVLMAVAERSDLASILIEARANGYIHYGIDWRDDRHPKAITFALVDKHMTLPGSSSAREIKTACIEYGDLVVAQEKARRNKYGN